MRRRDFLVGGAGALLAACAKSRSNERAQGQVASAKPAPRALVIIQMSGGFDPILTVDPKTPDELESWVDNPVRAADIIEAGGIRLGPQFAPLARWSSKLAVLHGVQVESVNHPAASWQLVRMRRLVTETTPGILDVVGRHRMDRPLGSITLGDVIGRFYTPSWSVHGLPFVKGRASTPQGLAPFEQMSPDELAMLSRALRAQLSSASLRATDRRSIEQVAALLERLPQAKKFALADWKPDTYMANADEGLQRVLWGLENELMATAYVVVTRNDWDTHHSNMTRQENVNGTFMALFDRFLEQMSTRRNAHGTLLDQTTIVLASELGRYPRLNSDKGKDHFPEMSMVFLGAGIAGGRTIGATGRDMIGHAMSFETGRLEGRDHVLLDDVGATLLHLFGIDGIPYGYDGRIIQPLLA
jgi:uncharacterized protein (DUF1501 family)